ncbi:MAG: aldehyde dehydrogenase family protein, partial [Elusimicrobia bacterium]|nr:aldehyde dehydrogenase family protein [Elusimicrobiota bacterium]
MTKIQNLIGGRFSDAASGHVLDNLNPATGAVYSRVPDSGEEDAAAAVAAAQAAFPAWSRAKASERAQRLRSLAALIDENLDALAKAETTDTGKPLALSTSIDIPRSALNFRFFADAITQVANESHATDDTALNYTLRRPLGVVACISPWNLPLYLLSWKVAPALAMGNCVVAKPSELTPMTAYLLSKLSVKASLPPGVLNIVHGTGAKAGAALVRHPGIKAVSFTGSTRTGAEITRVASPLFKKLSLEMGGKNPNIVFADAPFEEALATTLRSSFANQGQICLCGSRIYVERPIYEKFKTGLIERARSLKIGDPLEAGTDQGALV